MMAGADLTECGYGNVRMGKNLCCLFQSLEIKEIENINVIKPSILFQS